MEDKHLQFENYPTKTVYDILQEFIDGKTTKESTKIVLDEIYKKDVRRHPIKDLIVGRSYLLHAQYGVWKEVILKKIFDDAVKIKLLWGGEEVVLFFGDFGHEVKYMEDICLYKFNWR